LLILASLRGTLPSPRSGGFAEESESPGRPGCGSLSGCTAVCLDKEDIQGENYIKYLKLQQISWTPESPRGFAVHYSQENDRRTQPRHDYVSTVRYSPHPLRDRNELDGYTLNLDMSGAGLCLSVTRPLEVGQEIVITNSLMRVLRRRYRVRWVRQNKKHRVITYMAGLTTSGSEQKMIRPQSPR
jgi:hypothetical protein